MDLMDEELLRVLAGTAEPTRRRVEVPPTAAELAAASRPSFRMSSPGRREQRGGGEALETIGSAVLGSVPAGLAGLGYLATGQGPEKAAGAVQRVQDYLTIDPKTEGGIRAVRGIAEGMAPLGAIPQAAGDVTLRATGSPLLATGAELLADPLNLLGIGAAAKPAARAAAATGRGVARAGRAATESLGPKAAEMAESYMRRAGMMPDIFIGKSAKTWDAASNARAVEMEKAGANPRDIWSQTGNWRAPDGQWRQEISDASLTVGRAQSTLAPEDVAKNQADQQRLQEIKKQQDVIGAQIDGLGFAKKDEAKKNKLIDEFMSLRGEENVLQNRMWMFRQAQRKQGEGKIGELVSGELLEAYPNLREFTLKDEPMNPYLGDVGSFDAPNKMVRLSAPEGERKPVFVHEGQHFVQEAEGFSPGAAPQSSSAADFQDYLRYMGEAEARAAQQRTPLSAAERRAIFPEASYDVPISELRDASTLAPRRREMFSTTKDDLTKAQGGAVGGNMSYTQAADVIANKLVGQGVDPDRAMTMALRMSDAHMKAGGAVLMNDGGDVTRRIERMARERVQGVLSRPEPMRKTWDGPLPNRPVVNGRKMVSAEELADFRRQIGAQMTLRDLLNADKGMGPSATNPAARGVQEANIAPRSARVRPDETATLPPMKAADIPGLIMQGMEQGAERVPAGRGAGAALVGAGLPRAMTGTKLLREHPSISPERRQMLKEMEDYISGLNKERIEPTFAAGGAAKGAAGAAARAAARAETRLAEKAAQEAAKKALEAAPPPSLTSAIDQANQMLAQGRSRPYAKPETVRQMMLERAVAISKDAPKLTEQEVASRAQRQVLARLKWERETRPELQKTYGELSPSAYDMPAPRRLRNAPEVVTARAERAKEFLSKPTEPWAPPPPEKQAFDRALIKEAMEGFPGIEQTRFPRYEAPRAQTDYINEIYADPANRALIKQQITRGLPLGGETFYASLYPLKMAALERGIPAEKFDQFVYQTAPASARNSIMNEMAVGQFLRDMNARGLPLDEDTVTAEMAKFKQQYGTGLPLMPVHREGVRNVIEGGLNMRELLKADIPTNYKIPTYGTQKAGDFGKSVVLDVHEAAGQTQGSRFHPYFTEQGGFGPTEYGLAESKMLDIAKEMGIPGGTAQAGRWFGGGELTGLKSPRGDALDLLEKQTAYTLQGQGINPTPKAVREYLLDMINTGRGVLMPYFKSAPMPDVRTVKKEGGEVTHQGALA